MGMLPADTQQQHLLFWLVPHTDGPAYAPRMLPRRRCTAGQFCMAVYCLGQLLGLL